MAVDVGLTLSFKAGMPKVLFKFPSRQASVAVERSMQPNDGQKFVINLRTAPRTDEAPQSPITVVLNWQAGLKK